MNWDAIGAIGEVAGALAVVATLAYLATQLRQNTRALRSTSYEHWNTLASSYFDFLATYSVELSEIEKADSEAEISPELIRIHIAQSFKAANQAETAYLLNREGNLAPDVYEARVRAYIFYLQMSALNYESFVNSKDTRIEEFNDFIERRFSEAGT